MFEDYKLVFTDEAQSLPIIAAAVDHLENGQSVVYVIGIHREYVYDENDPEAPPTEVILSEGWHVDLRLREANESLEPYRIYPNTPVHAFS
jgi:hypothetical protein